MTLQFRHWIIGLYLNELNVQKAAKRFIYIGGADSSLSRRPIIELLPGQRNNGGETRLFRRFMNRDPKG